MQKHTWQLKFWLVTLLIVIITFLLLYSLIPNWGKIIGGLTTVIFAAFAIYLFIDAGQQKSEEMFDKSAGGFRCYILFFIISLILTIFVC